MEQATLTIAGKIYPIAFRMKTFRDVMRSLDTDLTGMAEKQGSTNMHELLDFTGTVAYHAMKTAAQLDGKPAPFADVDSLMFEIQSLSELQPAIQGWTDAIAAFYGTDGEPEGNGETLAAKPAKKTAGR